MAVLFFQGFESGLGSPNISGPGTNDSIQTSVVRTGAYALRCNPNGAAQTGFYTYGKFNAITNVMANIDLAEIFFSFYFRYATRPGAGQEHIARVLNMLGGAPLTITLRSDGKLEFWPATGPDLIGTTVLAANTWYLFEVRNLISAVGQQQMKINGVVEFTVNGNTGVSNNRDVLLGKSGNTSGQAIDVFYDDLCIVDAATGYPGGVQVLDLRPIDNGTFSDWSTGTGASDYQEVNDTPIDSSGANADYIRNSGAVINQVSTFLHTDVADLPILGPIRAVMPYTYCRVDTAGVPATQIRFRVNGTNFDTGAFGHSAGSYTPQFMVYGTDPSTSLNWTRAHMHDLQAGPKDPTAVSTRCAGVGISVLFAPGISTTLSMQDWEFGSILGNFMLANTNLANVSYQTAVVRSGTYAFRSNPAGAAIGWIGWGRIGDPTVDTSALTNRGLASYAGNPTSVFIRTYFQWLTKPAANNEEIMAITFNDTGNNATIIVTLRSDQRLQVFDSAGVSVGIGATVLASGTWYRIEFNGNKGVAAPFELRIDGVTELSGVANQTALDMALTVLGKRANRNGQSVDFYYDDFITDSSDWPGPGRILNLKPTANGTFTEWSAGTGASGFAEIDEIPVDDDTSYIAVVTAVPKTSTFFYTPAGVSGVVKAIQPWCSWRTTGGGGDCRIRVISGVTTDDSVVTRTGAAYRANYNLYNINPNTGLPWTKPQITLAQMGPRTAVNDSHRCTGAGIFVAFDDEAGGGAILLPVLGAGR